MDFLDRATSLDFFLKPYQNIPTIEYPPYELFNSPVKLSNNELPSFDPFFNILRNSNPVEKDYAENLVKSGLLTEQALSKLKMENVPPTVAENIAYLISVWANEHKESFWDFRKSLRRKMLFRHWN